MNRYVLIGGGTGGHCIPMNVLYDYIIKDSQCIIITDTKGMRFFKNRPPESIIVLKKLINSQSQIAYLINLPYLFVKSLWILLQVKPSALIGFGGYFTIPVISAGWIIGISVFIHEGNALIGKANKFLSNFAKKTFTTFKKTIDQNHNVFKKSLHVGLPIRYSDETLHNIDTDQYTICVLGGSQGAKNLSFNVAEAINSVQKQIKENIIVYHQCRKEDVRDIMQFYNSHQITAKVKNYFSEMINLIANSNLIISRSGSSTVNEIINNGIPSILIPFPYASDNHQFYNAQVLNEINCSVLIEDKNANAKNLEINILNYIKNKHKNLNISNQLKSLITYNPSLKIIDEIETKT